MNLTALQNYQNVVYRGAETQTTINRLIAISIRNIIENFFMHLAPSIIIIVSCQHPMHFYRSIMEHLYKTVDDIAIQLVQVTSGHSERIEGPRIYNVLLLVDSYEAFLDVNIASYTESYDSPEYYYIFLEQRDHLVLNDMQAILEYCWRHQLINCNVQIKTASDELVTYTYFPYTSEHCNQVKAVRINRFEKSMRWLNADFFPNKLKNFHQCTLVVAVRERPPYLGLRKLQKSSQSGNGTSLQFYGLEGELLRQLSKELNFSVEIFQSDRREKRLPSAGNTLNANTIDLLAARNVHLAIGFFRRRSTLSHLTTSTFPHYQSTLVASILLNAHNLTTYEMLTFPFHHYTWLAIVAAFISSSLALVALQQVHVRYVQSQFKAKPPAALFSMITTLLGIPLTTQPHTLSERFFYLAWILTTFVWRAMYSALLYHLFRNTVYQSLPTTLLQLFDFDYAVVANRFTMNDIPKTSDQQFSRMGLIILNSTHDDDVFTYLEAHAADDVAAVASRDFLVNYATRKRMPGMFRIIKEHVMNLHLTIHLTKHSFLLQELDAFIMRVQAVGLMDIWTEWHLNDKYFLSNHLHLDKLIGQHELSGMYVFLAVCYAMALVMFALELLSKRWTFLAKLFK